ncbi:hypothetical protein SPI_05217 [Niveomyces insectorum RCEF 264]|uniref:Pt repeat family protein n=1 Tax=Niveomyces insectorum RCEF 264 TaxID=1081102 RepID=A0A167U2Y4_9HYPO|nr:hypothetical protein SPI_05217 [Niveomyces insectorum RCEF 264]
MAWDAASRGHYPLASGRPSTSAGTHSLLRRLTALAKRGRPHSTGDIRRSAVFAAAEVEPAVVVNNPPYDYRRPYTSVFPSTTIDATDEGSSTMMAADAAAYGTTTTATTSKPPTSSNHFVSTSSRDSKGKMAVLTTAPFRVQVEVRFPGLRSSSNSLTSGVSTYTHEYASSQTFVPSDRLCNGLLRRLTHCSTELITRKDSDALQQQQPQQQQQQPPDRPRFVKPLKYELHFRILRRDTAGAGGSAWAERTFCSYQKQALTAHDAREVVLATHRMVGLFLRRHDPSFRWMDVPAAAFPAALSRSPTDTTPALVRPVVDEPLPLCCVPRSRFLDASQSYEFVPGYAIHLSFHSRSRSRSRQQYDWKRSVRLPSRQTAPLSLALAEDLLWRTFDSLHQALTERRTAFFDEHKACDRLEGIDGVQQFDDDALGIELRIQNHLGPDYNHLHRAIRSKLNLFPHPDALDCQQFLQDVHDNFVRARDDTDAELARLPDFDLRVVTLRGPGWSVGQPARFVLDSSASHSRRSIEAILDRVQTGTADVLRGSNASIHILAYKRGQLVLDTTMLAHRDLANPPPSTTLTADEQQASTLVSLLKTRIQRDLDMVCKDTCSLDDASDDRSAGPAPADAAENKTVTPQSPLVEAATAPVADDEPNTPAPRVVELPGDVVFDGLPPDSLPSTPTSSRRAFPLIPERFNLSSSRSSSVGSVPASPKEETPSNASLITTPAIPETSALETSEQGPSTQCEEPSVEALPGAEPATEMQPDEHQPAESKSEPERVPTEMSTTDSAQEVRSEVELRPASPVPPCELESGTESAPQPGLIPEPQPVVALETQLEEIPENATVPESEPEPEARPEIQLEAELKGQTEMEPESQNSQPTADNDVELMPPPPDDREVELGEMEEGLISVAAPDEPILPPWPTVSEGTEDDAVSQAQIILADAIATAVAEAIAEPIFDDEDLVMSSSPLARGQNLFPTADHTLLNSASTNTTRPSTPSLSVSSGEVNSPRISLLETPEAAHEARADVLTGSDSETDDMVYRRGYGADNEPNPDGGCFSSFAPSTKSASTVRKLTFLEPLSVPFPLESENGSTIGGLSPTEIIPEIIDTPISEEHLEQPTEVVLELDSVPSGEPLMHFDDFAATKPTLNLEDDADFAVNDSTISVGLSPATGKDVALENSQLKDSGYGGEELSFAAPAESKASEDTTPAFERLRISSHDKAGPTLSDLLADSECNSDSESLQIMLPEYAPSLEEQKLEPILEVLDEEENTPQQLAPDQEFTEPEQALVQTPDSETEADTVFARSEEPGLETIHESAFAPLDESGETIDPVPQDPGLHSADAEFGQHSHQPTVPEFGPIPEPEIPEAPVEVENRPKPDFIGRELELVNRKLELVDTEIDLIDTEIELVDTELDFVNSELELAYAESEPAEEPIPQQPDSELEDGANPRDGLQENVDVVLSELQPPSDSEEDENAANPPDDILPSTAQPTAGEEVHFMDGSVHEPLLEIQPELVGQSETSILPECEGFENPLALEMADTREPSTPLPLIPTEEVDGPHPASNAEKNIDLLKTQQIGPRVVVSVRQTVTDFARSLIPRFCEAVKPAMPPLKDTVPTSSSSLSPFAKVTADDSSGPDDSEESSAEESSRGSVDTFRSCADEEPVADEHPHLSSLPTAGYFGLRETKLVEVGLRGALTGSHAFDNVSGISR